MIIFIGLPYINTQPQHMVSALEEYFLQKEEPDKSCLQSLRGIILSQDKEITESLKYGMPFYSYHGKMFCYLWTHKKYKQPYIGIVEGKRLDHPELIQEKRARMKILLIDARKDIPLRKVRGILREVLALYK